MKIFLSSLQNARVALKHKHPDDNSTCVAMKLVRQGVKMKYNLMSYYYARNCIEDCVFIRDNTELVVIDSGAHSFQYGKTVDWVEYTKEYAEFIKRYDRPNVLGYFEMDIDNVVGYKKVLQLRKILESASDKIIPVWHKNRGLKDFDQMCKKYAGKVISITGFRNADIRDDQYAMFVKHAKQYGCKVFCLGMTRQSVIDKVPFDFVDSSSWSAQTRYGRVGNRKVKREVTTNQRPDVFVENYKIGMAKQKKYYEKWKSVCKD